MDRKVWTEELIQVLVQINPPKAPFWGADTPIPSPWQSHWGLPQPDSSRLGCPCGGFGPSASSIPIPVVRGHPCGEDKQHLCAGAEEVLQWNAWTQTGFIPGPNPAAFPAGRPWLAPLFPTFPAQIPHSCLRPTRAASGIACSPSPQTLPAVLHPLPAPGLMPKPRMLPASHSHSGSAATQRAQGHWQSTQGLAETVRNLSVSG